MDSKLSKIKSLMNLANNELAHYERTKSWGHLSQACEKTWVAFNLLVELKSGLEIKHSKPIKGIAYGLGLNHLYHLTNKLHIVHYEGVKDDESLVPDDVREAIGMIRAEV